jgi:galactonate dehydratase
MKITDLKILHMSTPTQARTNWLFVRIETDAGIYGLGEASLQYKDEALIAELETFKRYLVGQDPFRIEHIWTSLHRRVTWSGGPVTMSAISAIDLALWDIKGRALGVPVYELLGGKVRDRMRVYANGWPDGAQGPEGYAQRAAEVAALGYTCLKFYPFSGAQVITPERIEQGVETVRAVRAAVGPHCEIGIDVRARLNIWSARRVAFKLEPYDVAWIEEPILYDNVEAMAALARQMRIPVATGEQLYTRWEFRALLEQNAVSIVQPDICHAGGISELKKIAAMAECYTVTVAPHNSNGPLSTIASLHLDMCIPNAFMQEVFLNFLPRYNEVLTQPIEIVDGHCTPPDGPGWGVDLREDVLAKYPPVPFTPVESEPYREF